MVHVITAPEPLVWPAGQPAVFLAGSIEMGTAVNWQQAVVDHLADLNAVFLNPRREQWDASWAQNRHNEPFRQQVEWELKALERCHFILMHFEPQTKSPVTLLELGLYARSGKLFVSCPDGFWRQGNVHITCHRYGVPVFAQLADAVHAVGEALTHVVAGPARAAR